MLHLDYSGDPGDWDTKTHVWEDAVDFSHLEEARSGFGHVGLEHMILEVLAYANDEAISRGVVGDAIVTVTDEGVCIDDDGRGTETRRGNNGRIIRKPVMSSRDVRFYGNPLAPLLPDGNPRSGMSIVAAQSALLTHENHRAYGSWRQTYRYGVPQGVLVEIPFRGFTGTVVTFSTDEVLELDLDRCTPLLLDFTNLNISVRDRRWSSNADDI